MPYNKSISISKAKEGSIDGVIAAAVTTIVIAVIKNNVSGIDANTENAIAAGVGLVVSGIVVGVKKFWDNFRKHKADK